MAPIFAIVGTSIVKRQMQYLSADFSVQSFPGKTIEQIHGFMTGVKVEAEVLFVHAGSNDVSNGYNISLCMKRYGELISELREVNPHLHIVLSAILPRRESRLDGEFFGLSIEDYTTRQEEFNAELALLSSRFPNASLLEHAEFNWSWVSKDGVHLSHHGNEQLAAAFSKHSLNMVISTEAAPEPASFVNDCISDFVPAIEEPAFADVLKSGLMSLPPVSRCPCPSESKAKHLSKKPEPRYRRRSLRARRNRSRRQFRQRYTRRTGFCMPEIWAPRPSADAHATYLGLQFGDLEAKLHPTCFISGRKMPCSETVKRRSHKSRRTTRRSQTLEVVQVPLCCPFCTDFMLEDELLDHIIAECSGLQEERTAQAAQEQEEKITSNRTQVQPEEPMGPVEEPSASTCSTEIHLSEAMTKEETKMTVSRIHHLQHTETCIKLDFRGGGVCDLQDESKYKISTLVVGNPASLNPKSTKILPPVQELQTLLSLLNDSNYVSLPCGDFNRAGILSLLDRHKTIFQTESKWISNNNLANYTLKTRIPVDEIKLFFQHIMLTNGNEILQLPGHYQLTKDKFSSLLCDRWIWDCVILKFLEIVMMQQQDVYAGYLSNISDFLKAGEHVKAQYGSDIKKCVFPMNVKIDNLPELAFLRTNITGLDDINEGNHFSFCILDIASAQPKLTYIDTLGYPVPPSLEDALKEFLLGYGFENFRDLTVSACHMCWGTNCSNQCTIYPKQTCATICGPAAICGIAFCIFCPDEFSSLLNLKRGANLPESLSMLSYFIDNISSHSTLFRLSIANWILKGEINIGNILFSGLKKKTKLSLGKKSRDPSNSDVHQDEKLQDVNKLSTEQPCFSSDTDSKLQETSKNIDSSNHTCSNVSSPKSSTKSSTRQHVKFKSTDKIIFDVPLSVSKLLKGNPVLTFHKPKTLSLRCFLKNSANPVKRIFRCTESGKNDTVAIGKINDFLKSVECKNLLENKFNAASPLNVSDCETLEDLLQTKPIILKRSSNDLVVRFCLKNGKEFNKKFKYSDHGEQTQSNLQLFLDSGEALVWIKDKINSHSQWIEDGDLDVGVKTKEYFDEFKFDIMRTKIQVHKSVEVKYHDQTARVSVVENEVWGKTHRFDEYYHCADAIPDGHFPVVTMYIKCASKSQQCRSRCFTPLTDIDTSIFVDTAIKVCPACKKDIDIISRVCEYCTTENSHQWYVLDNKQCCTACYKYIRKYGIGRPSKLYDSEFECNRKNPSYNCHFICNWQLKLVLYSDKMSTWKVYSWYENSKYHQQSAVQMNKKPSLFHRDIVDFHLVSQRSTAKQIYISQNRKTSIHVNSPGKQSQSFQSIKQIQRRLETVDAHEIKRGMKNADKFPLFGSDWRNTEKFVESNLDGVLLFQRGFSKLDRNYHIVLAKDSNLINVRKFGQHVLGYDTKHDYVSVRFSTGMVTFADAKNNGRIACVGLCNREDASSHALTLQTLFANIPCSDETCSHERQLHIFNDQHGFFFFRPCSLKEPLKPMIQHDKSSSIKAAVSELGLSTTLCNFHALSALREHIVADSSLKMFLRPLETGFKVVMRSWNEETYETLINGYLTFVTEEIPETFVNSETKDKLKEYLNNNWFYCVWSHDFTSEVLYKVPLEERRNPLLLTDNITERKFRDIDESLFNSHLNKTVANFIHRMTDMFLPADQTECHHPNPDLNNFRLANVTHKSEEMNRIEKALNMFKDNAIVEISQTDGWILLLNNIQKANLQGAQLSDNFFTGETDAHPDVEMLEDVDVVFSQKSVQSLVKEITDEHSYDAVNSCKTLIFELQAKSCLLFKKHLKSCLPNSLRPLYKDEHIICNLEFGVCSCMHFVIRGQPYFCKHLYACLAKTKGIQLAIELFQAYLKHVPTFRLEETKENPGHSRLTRIQQLLTVSHSASPAELEAANNGTILN